METQATKCWLDQPCHSVNGQRTARTSKKGQKSAKSRLSWADRSEKSPQWMQLREPESALESKACAIPATWSKVRGRRVSAGVGGEVALPSDSDTPVSRWAAGGQAGPPAQLSQQTSTQRQTNAQASGRRVMEAFALRGFMVLPRSARERHREMTGVQASVCPSEAKHTDVVFGGGTD